MDGLFEKKYIVFTVSSDELGKPVYDYTTMFSYLLSAQAFVEKNLLDTSNVKFPSVKNVKSKQLMLSCPHEDMNISTNYTYYGKRSDIKCDTPCMYYTGYVVEETPVYISGTSETVYGIFKVCYDTEDWVYYDLLYVTTGLPDSVEYIKKYCVDNNITEKDIHYSSRDETNILSHENVDFIVEKL